MSKELIENVVSKINSEIVNCSKILKENKVPDFSVLNNLVQEFTDNISRLNTVTAAEYSGLLQIWSGELKSVIDNLNSTKSGIQQQLEGALLNDKVMNSYNKLN